MTVIRPNSISGITSLTAHRGSIDFYAHDGSAATFNNINSNVTSGVSTFASLNITGDLDVGGALTYEDVTNVDSIGVVTARNGIDVTGGTVTITTGANSASPAGGGDNLVIKDSDGCGLSILSGNGNSQNIYLGSVSDNDAVRLEGFYNSGSPYFNIYTGGTERLRVNSDGKLSITGSTANMEYLRMGGNNDRGLRFTSSSGSSSVGVVHTINAPGDNSAQGAIVLQTNSTERLRITSDGKIGVSEATPDSKVDILHSTSTNTATENLIHLRTDPGGSYVTRGLYVKIGRDGQYDNSAAHYDIVGSAGNSGFHVFEVQGDEKLRITKDGKIGVGQADPQGDLHIGNISGNKDLIMHSANNGNATIRFREGGSNSSGFNEYSFGMVGSGNAMTVNGQGAGEIIRILGDTGRVGVNCTPLSHFQVKGATDANIALTAMGGEAAIEAFNDAGSANVPLRIRGTDIKFFTSSTERLRINSTGRVTISPDNSYAGESTNILMTIIASGGDQGGYPGITLRSTDSGGGTNSQNGMSIISTDSNWSLYSNSGNVHGLGLFTGNSNNSGNCGLYLRSDKKITMGPETNNEAFTTNTCGQAVHIAGGGLGIGAISNYTNRSGEGGRDVRGWYHANAYTGRGSNSYLHLTTSLWGGGSPHGNSEYIMGGFRITSYRYSPAGVAEELIMFHNWNGGMAGYTRTYTGTWDPGSYVYERGTGFVTLRLTSQNYVGHIIDLIQYNWYPVREIRVTSANFSNTATL